MVIYVFCTKKEPGKRIYFVLKFSLSTEIVCMRKLATKLVYIILKRSSKTCEMAYKSYYVFGLTRELATLSGNAYVMSA